MAEGATILGGNRGPRIGQVYGSCSGEQPRHSLEALRAFEHLSDIFFKTAQQPRCCGMASPLTTHPFVLARHQTNEAHSPKCPKTPHFCTEPLAQLAEPSASRPPYDPRMSFDPFPAIQRGTPGQFAEVWNPVQREIARRVEVRPLEPLPRFVAGADCAFTSDKRSIYAVALVWDREERRLVELATEFREVDVPYVGGYLSFREGPAILAAVERLKHPFGAITFDGQGVAHPRRAGLASHLGVTLDLPSVGVAKSRLIGTFDEPAPDAGSRSPLIDRGEEIGTVLRTRSNVRPLFVSIGHKVDIDSAAALVMACVTKYRIPEPTRLADIEVAKMKVKIETNARCRMPSAK